MGPFSTKSSDYLDQIEARISSDPPEAIAATVVALARRQDAWRRSCINLNPAETLMSLTCRNLLDSDMAGRITEGNPGDKLYPHGALNQYFDEIEAIAIAYVRRLFGARFVEWRPVSATMASAAIYHALLKPGDVVLTQSENGGGNYAYQPHGTIGLTGASVAPIPIKGDAFEIDIDGLATLADSTRPRMIVVGGSNILFPYPLRTIRKIADRVGALVVYDAAHVGLFISQGEFQRPLVEGADVTLLTTAKIMAGPITGLVLTDNPEIASQISRVTFPSLLQKRDMNKAAALALALAETAQFGVERAKQSVANAQALGGYLETEGFSVLAADRGYTQTHQIFLRLGEKAREFETSCNEAHIMLTDCALTGDIGKGARSGCRLGVHEITRIGMKEPEMKVIAHLIRRAVDGEPSDKIRREVALLLSHYPNMAFSFDQGLMGITEANVGNSLLPARASAK